MRRRKPWHLFDPRHIGIILGDGQLHTPQRFGVYTSLSGHRFGVYTSLCPQALGVYTSLFLAFSWDVIILYRGVVLLFGEARWARSQSRSVYGGLSALGGYEPAVI